VSGIHPPFNRDGSLDVAGLRREIDHNLGAGSRTLLMTYWDGLHSVLTDAEVTEVLRVVVGQARGQALVVAADRQWWTGAETAFADHARDMGADVLMVLPPNWGGSLTQGSVVAHYQAVAEHIPVMVVTGAFSAQRALGLRVIRRLVETVPNIVAVKEDVGGEFARKVALMAHDRWAVLSGGLKQDHLSLLPYGCDGYMSWYLHCRAGDLVRLLADDRGRRSRGQRADHPRLRLPLVRVLGDASGRLRCDVPRRPGDLRDRAAAGDDRRTPA